MNIIYTIIHSPLQTVPAVYRIRIKYSSTKSQIHSTTKLNTQLLLQNAFHRHSFLSLNILHELMILNDTDVYLLN